MKENTSWSKTGRNYSFQKFGSYLYFTMIMERDGNIWGENLGSVYIWPTAQYARYGGYSEIVTRIKE